MRLDSSMSTVPSGLTGLFAWSQLSGVQPVAQRKQGDHLEFVSPVVSELQTLVFELDVSAGQASDKDTTEVDVLPCTGGADTVYIDCLSHPFGPMKAYEDLHNGGNGTKYFGDQGHVQWQAKPVTARGNILEVSWNVEDADSISDDKGWFGFEVAAGSRNLSSYKNGAVTFDLRFVKNTDPSIPFYFRLECGNQCRSDDFAIRPSQMGSQWRTFRCLLYTSPSPRDLSTSRMPSSA